MYVDDLLFCVMELLCWIVDWVFDSVSIVFVDGYFQFVGVGYYLVLDGCVVDYECQMVVFGVVVVCFVLKLGCVNVIVCYFDFELVVLKVVVGLVVGMLEQVVGINVVIFCECGVLVI